MSETNRWRRKALRVAKSALCVMLCCVMVFAYSFKKPTEAHATSVVVGVVGAVAVAAAVSALGICVNGLVNNEDFKASCQQIWDNIDDGIKRKVTMTAISAGAVYYLTSEFLTAVGTQIKTAYDTAAKAVQDQKELSSKINNIPMQNLSYYNTFGELCTSMGYTNLPHDSMSSLAGDVISSYKILGTVAIGETFNYGGILHCSKIVNGVLLISENGGSYYTTKFNQMNNTTLGILMYLSTVSGSTISHCYVIYSGQAGVNILGIGSATAEIPSAPGRDVLGIDVDNWYADGYSALNHTVSDVVGKVVDSVGVTGSDGSVSIPVDVPTTEVTTQTQTQTQSDTLNKDIADTASKEANDETNKGKNTAPPKLPGLPDITLPKLLTTKFPFCIPFDIYVIISGFYCAEAKAPCWEIPVENDRLGWHWKIVLDWSQFEPIAVLCRWFTGAAWVFALILATRKLIGAGGGD